MIVYRPKSELKWMRYQQNTQNPNEYFNFFFKKKKEKLAVFGPTLPKKLGKIYRDLAKPT